MSIASDIQNLYEFSKDKDKNFQDFSQNLLCFCEEQKEKTNINDIENFHRLIGEHYGNSNFDENYKNSLLSLLEMLREKGFIEYQQFYENFKQNFIAEEYDISREKVLEDDFKSCLVDELLINKNFSELIITQQDLENLKKENETNIQENTNFDENIDEKSQNVALSDENKQVAVTPSDMIAFIKDEKTLIFPFTKGSTLDNKEFMKAFFADLDSRSNQELEMLLAKIRAKNEALRTELLNLKRQEQGVKEKIESELKTNSALKENKKDLDNQGQNPKSQNLQNNKEEKNLSQTLKESNSKLDIAIKKQDERQKEIAKWKAIEANKQKAKEKEEQDEEKIQSRKQK